MQPGTAPRYEVEWLLLFIRSGWLLPFLLVAEKLTEKSSFFLSIVEV